MIKNFMPGDYEIIKEYELVFDDGHNNGYAFPCDEKGNVKFYNDYARDNYQYCLDHPEEFVRWNEITCWERVIHQPNSGVCNCGYKILLENNYLGACECEHCGQWWNVWGQELLPPERWGNGDDW